MKRTREELERRDRRIEKKEKLDVIHRLRRLHTDVLIDLDWLVEGEREYCGHVEALAHHVNRSDYYFSRLILSIKRDLEKLKD